MLREVDLRDILDLRSHHLERVLGSWSSPCKGEVQPEESREAVKG
jgi:hypothetical protein